MPSYAGLSWDMLEREGAVVAPKFSAAEPSHLVLFQQTFPTASGRGRFVPVSPLPAAELPDDDYPMVLITGRVLEHWHTGSMTRRADVLDALDPVPWCGMHLDHLASIGVLSGGAFAGDAARQLERRRGRTRGASRLGLHGVLLPRGGGQPADPAGARPLREDSRVQVLRVAGVAGGYGAGLMRPRDGRATPVDEAASSFWMTPVLISRVSYRGLLPSPRTEAQIGRILAFAAATMLPAFGFP